MKPDRTDTQTVQQTEGGGTVASSAGLGILDASLDPVNSDAAKALSYGKPTVPYIETLEEAMKMICDKILCGTSIPHVLNNLKAGATTTYAIIITPTKKRGVQVELECTVSPMKRCVLNVDRLKDA